MLKEEINELEGIVIESTKNETQRGGKNLKKKKKNEEQLRTICQKRGLQKLALSPFSFSECIN